MDRKLKTSITFEILKNIHEADSHYYSKDDALKLYRDGDNAVQACVVFDELVETGVICRRTERSDDGEKHNCCTLTELGDRIYAELLRRTPLHIMLRWRTLRKMEKLGIG